MAKRKPGWLVLAVAGGLLLGTTAMGLAAQDTPVALVGARIHTAAGPAIENGTIIFQDGVITAMGADVPRPDGAEIVDVSGMVIMPGMLDNHSHIGMDVGDLNEFPTRFGPQHRIRDVLSPDDAFWKGAVKGGVTTVVTGPGSGEVSSGQAIVIKTWGESIEVGKDADVVVFDGDPLSIRTWASRVYVDGRLVYERQD